MQWWGDRTIHVFITLYLPEFAKMQFLGTNLGAHSGSPAKEVLGEPERGWGLCTHSWDGITVVAKEDEPS